MLLDTSANRTVILERFLRNQKLFLIFSKIKSIKLADEHQIPSQHANVPFQIKLGDISLSILGPVREELSNNVVVGFN